MNKRLSPSLTTANIRRPAIIATLILGFAVGGYYVAAPPSTQGISSGIVISQIYGGGGNSGATFKNDFIELFNRGASPVTVTGWSVQYASSTGTTWQVTNLTGTIAPGRYYLVQESAGAGGTTSLPTPDATGSIAMSATTGKVALASSTTALTGACPTGAAIVDFVGYGTPNCFEGAAAVPALTNTTAALRNSGGCTDTDNNQADFAAGPANPRNSSSAINACGGSTNPSGVGSANPNSVAAGSTSLLTVAVTPGTGPASTGLTVSGNLTSIGGAASQQFFDDGTHGDLTAGDNTFSFQAAVDAGTSPGAKSIPISIADDQARTGSTAIALTVTAAQTNPTGTGAANPNSVLGGGSTLLTVAVTPGTNPTSTGLSVTGNLTSIGGSAAAQFFDDGTHGDAAAGDGTFSLQATVLAGTPPGPASIPVAIADTQGRSGSATISLTVLPPPPPNTVKISQVYGGGGNSGTTYKNDFIELYNSSNSTVDLTGWSVQYLSATLSGTWQVTPISGSIAPGHYYLVQEAPGAGGTTDLPAPDATGVIAMSSTNAKVALVNTATPLTGCPVIGTVVDLVGYGTANCFETAATPSLSNATAAIRKGNGCIDTNNNSADFIIDGPIPRNSASPANSCGGDPANISGIGTASPSALDPSEKSLLTVTVTGATTPPSTGITVVGNLTNIGGSAAQQFYDDGTHGDLVAGDNVFSFLTAIAPLTSPGAKSITTVIADAQSRNTAAPITLTISSPTCGVERWSVKTGTDPDAGLVDLSIIVPTTIAEMRSWTAPDTIPLNNRVQPHETSVYRINGTLTLYKKEDDVDYHIVIQDESGNTVITEIPCPCCIGPTSPFGALVANARAQFDSRLTATDSFQSANIPVQVTGIAFFDFLHGQTGVAPNGIELHPILDIVFNPSADVSITNTANANSITTGSNVIYTMAVSNDGPNDAAKVTVADTLPPNLTFVSCGVFGGFGGSCGGSGNNVAVTFTSLPAHATATITIVATVNCSVADGTVISNTALVGSSTPDSNGNNNAATAMVKASNPPPILTCPTSVPNVPVNQSCQAALPAVTGSVTTSDNSGPVTVSQSPKAGTLVDPGTHTITVTATDGAGASSQCAISVVVQDVTPPVPNLASLPTITEQCSATVSAPTATDACAGQVTATTTDPTTYSSQGTFTIHWAYTDPAGNTATQAQTVIIKDTTAPTITAPPAIATSTGPGATVCGLVISDAALGSPSASDNCGAPSVSRSGVPAGNLFPVGVTTITYTATDAGGNTATATQVITVADKTPPAITCPANITTPGNIPGQCSANVNPGLATSTDNCGPVTVSGVRSDNQPLNAPYPPGTTVITWTAKDAANNSASCTQQVTVTNPNPVVTITGPPSGSVFAAITNVNFTGSFADNAGGSHTAQWTFGTISQPGTLNESTGAVSATYNFKSAGLYPVTLTVNDGCGGSGSAATVGGLPAIVVIYDPLAGFVTGGGWITSPAGAYAANPAFTGKADLQFDSKYENVATIPAGKTIFSLEGATFEFHSTAYEWLVVTGARAEFKGSGTLNGGGNYGFIATVIDADIAGGGKSDKFRIRIWDKNNNNAIVYDNQSGAPDTGDASTPLGGGNIVIHK